jgi:NAD(P)-dependent dehydrogenase (short-subunit alcohol dehydrogenase family)
MSAFSIENKVILVTGAGNGIGKAVAEALHARGGRLVLVDLESAACERLADSLGREVLCLAADVTDAEGMERAVREGVERFRRLDMVFANAGIVNEPATVANMGRAEFERVLEVNLMGAYRTVKPCLPHILQSGGHILLASSIYAFMNGTTAAPYAVSKAGIEMLGRSLRGELAGSGATAGVLIPGWVQTRLASQALGGNRIATRLQRLAFPGPLKYAITPETVAQAVVRGVERRAPRIIVPRRWVPLFVLRGLVAMILDAVLDREKGLHKLIRKL